MTDLIFLALVVLGFNLMPAFAPPTWTALVLFGLNTDLNPFLIVGVGAVCAGTGRYLLARGTGLFRNHIGKKSLENLEAAEMLLTQNTSRKVMTLGLFILSPLPSAQLFEAAGLMKTVTLKPLLAAFAAGRSFTYSTYVTGASVIAASNYGEIFISQLKSPWAIAVQIAMIAGLIALGSIDWKKRLKSHSKACD